MTPSEPGRAARQAAPDSFIRSARRAQIVESAIEVIAASGLAQASEVRIARHAGVSRGVVAYHFRDATDLADAVVAEVYRRGGERLRERVAGAPSPRDGLLAFVGGSVELYAELPQHIAALREIFAARRRPGAAARDDAPQHAQELDDLAGLLAAGQAEGQFRAFDVVLMSAVVRSVIDAAVPRVVDATGDVTDLADELVAAVDALVRMP